MLILTFCLLIPCTVLSHLSTDKAHSDSECILQYLEETWVTEGKITVVEKGRKKISSVCVSKTLAFAWNMKRKDSNLLLLVIWLLQKKTIKSRVMNSRKISILLTSSSQTGFQTYIMSSLHQFLHQRMLWVLYKLSNYDFAKNKLTPLAPYQPFCGRWVALVSHSCPLSDHSKGSFLLFYGTDC